jgi:hypothetical protein
MWNHTESYVVILIVSARLQTYHQIIADLADVDCSIPRSVSAQYNVSGCLRTP